MRPSQRVDRIDGAPRARFGSAEGATAAEYAILAGLIAMVIVMAVFALGNTTSDAFCGPVPALGGAEGDC